MWHCCGAMMFRLSVPAVGWSDIQKGCYISPHRGSVMNDKLTWPKFSPRGREQGYK